MGWDDRERVMSCFHIFCVRLLLSFSSLQGVSLGFVLYHYFLIYRLAETLA